MPQTDATVASAAILLLFLCCVVTMLQSLRVYRLCIHVVYSCMCTHAAFASANLLGFDFDR